MRSLRRALLALGVLGLLAGALPLALALANEEGHQRELIAVFGPLIGWAFIGTGIFTWLRRPENGLGALMTAIGFSACLAGLRVSTDPWVFVFGLLFITSQWALLFHMLLAFPTGTLRSGFERLLVGAMYFSSLVVHPVQVLFNDTGRAGLPDNPLLIEGHRQLAMDIGRARFWTALVLIAALAAIIVRRWAVASEWQRRSLGPVFVAGGLVMALLGVWYAAGLGHADADFMDGLEDARYVVLATVPFAFLAGLLRSRVAGAAAVSDLVVRLGAHRGELREALAEALGDPSLELAYWLPERGEWVDAAGATVDLPTGASGRARTPVEQRGEPIAMLIHDPSVAEERELVRAVAGAAVLALENERLAAELRAKVHELRASRARIVESGDIARRRIERDLHDGAQQQLVALAMTLRAARSRVERDPAATAELLDAAGEALGTALRELRELARGIHPAVLSDRGLGPALDALAQRIPLPVEIVAAPAGRLPEPVEAAAYFVVAEALTNVARYAGASHARVSVTHASSRLLVEIADDGAGGADPSRGTGLRGLVDRVAALDGRLDVESPPGRGTTVRAIIPCALPVHAAHEVRERGRLA
jgi:signal transduction histidine kinase